MVARGRGGERRIATAAALGVAGLALLGVAAGRGDGGTSPPAAVETQLLVTTHPLAATAVIAAADVRVATVPASGFDSSWVHAPSDALGRRLLVPLSARAPVALAELGARGPRVEPARRTVRVELPRASVAADVGALTDAEVVASTDAAGSTRVAVVAICTVLSLDDALSTGEGTAGGAGAAHAAAPQLDVVLDCDAGAALRVVWAADFGHALRLITHPAGGAVASPATDLGR